MITNKYIYLGLKPHTLECLEHLFAMRCVGGEHNKLGKRVNWLYRHRSRVSFVRFIGSKLEICIQGQMVRGVISCQNNTQRFV